ncbi:phist protein [Plasmodium ovale curtisi]|uniref:Phist protein n=1 Tax=Plasmodium ovale curtisi TaxID=864141 RepID=A0A1A8VM14_PLAOA|nr:phist protein [Plasmodium ovale curtisi]
MMETFSKLSSSPNISSIFVHKRKCKSGHIHLLDEDNKFNRRKGTRLFSSLHQFSVLLLILLFLLLQNNYPYEYVGEINLKVNTEINAANSNPFHVMNSRGRCLRTPEDFPIRGINRSISIETIEEGNNELYSVEKTNNNLEDRKELEQLCDKEYGNGAVIKLSYINSEYLKQLIGEEYYGRINGLSNQIDPNSLFSVWSDIYGREKNELCSIEEDLWYFCNKIAEKYEVPKRLKLQEWLKIYRKLLIDLMKKEFSDLHDLLVFMENDSCTRSGIMMFVAGFILERIELWFGLDVSQVGERHKRVVTIRV